MKKVALINDLSGFGKCSLTAAIPVISVMGIQACPLPTAVLTGQTGFETYYCDDFTEKMDCFTEQWGKMGEAFDGIYSGFLASSEQLQKVNHFLDCFQTENNFFLADPVMGDHGNKYHMFSNELLLGMKKLTLRANVITPNLTELCLLAGEEYSELTAHRQDSDYLHRIQDMCEKLLSQTHKQQTIIVTGILRCKGDQDLVTNLAVSRQACVFVETPYTGVSFSGTGDLFASVICGCQIKGLSIQESMAKATDFLQKAIEEATLENIPRNHGVPFEKYLYKLI